jgi:adenosylcobyric acid synthase
MALNSFATREGHEIGRAQAMQAEAAQVEPHVDMNPILLKPTSDVGSQVILNGRVLGNFSGTDYYQQKPLLLDTVTAAYQRLAARHEIIVLEGAGSPVEMNLKDRDVVNLKMAEIADAACLLVTDIDRGGVFASLVGTYELLEPQERNRFFGFLINKFRGDASLFTPGISYLEERLAQTCLGVIPYLRDHGIDDEDSVSLERRAVRPPFDRKDCLCICVVGLPYLSNFTDFTALENVPGVVVYYTRRPEEARAADVLILPGSKNTIPDLVWLRKNGWEPVIESHAAAGKPLVGICGGFQMLGREIRDPHHTESDIERVSGLNLLNFTTVLEREKVTRQATARFAKPQSLGADAGENSEPLSAATRSTLERRYLGAELNRSFTCSVWVMTTSIRMARLALMVASLELTCMVFLTPPKGWRCSFVTGEGFVARRNRKQDSLTRSPNAKDDTKRWRIITAAI